MSEATTVTTNGVTTNGVTTEGVTTEGVTASGVTASGVTASGVTASGVTASGARGREWSPVQVAATVDRVSGLPVYRRPWMVDAVLAGLLLTWSLPWGEPRWGAAAVITLVVVPVAFRRIAPAAAFATTTLAAFVQWLSGPKIGVSDFAVLICLYSVAAYRGHRWSVPALGIGLFGAVLAWAQAWLVRGVDLLGLLPPVAVVTAVWLVGRTLRTRRGYLAELEQRAVRLERERDALARAAVAEERARIAREMHDVVAHTVAVMVAQAEGAGVAVRGAPDAAERALEVIADSGRTALAELRRTLGVLRARDPRHDQAHEAAAGTAPLPALTDMDQLVVSMRAAGLPVRYVQEGDPGTLDPTFGLMIYRIAQESLTNALKHAGPGSATELRCRCGDGVVELDVTNEGTGAARPVGAGHGLTGIQERVSLYGGRVEAGPTPSGGWRVQARIPRGTVPA